MSKIVYRGRTYNSVFEMPYDVRQAYDEERKRERSAETSRSATKSLTDLVEMSPEIREIYERAMGNVQAKSDSSQPLVDLPDTEELYRRSAPPGMRDLPSDEILYQPSRPVVDPIPPNIEPDEGIGMRGLMWGIAVALLLTGLAYLVAQFLPV